MSIHSSSQWDSFQSIIAQPNSPIDLDLLLNFTGHNWEFALEIIADFLSSIPIYIAESKQAIAEHNSVVLTNSVHKIKGASAQAAIKIMPNIAEELECQAKVTNLNNATELIGEIEQIFAEVKGLFPYQ